MIAELVLDLAVGLAALGTLPEWTIDDVCDVYCRMLDRGGHVRRVYRFRGLDSLQTRPVVRVFRVGDTCRLAGLVNSYIASLPTTFALKWEP